MDRPSPDPDLVTNRQVRAQVDATPPSLSASTIRRRWIRTAKSTRSCCPPWLSPTSRRRRSFIIEVETGLEATDVGIAFVGNAGLGDARQRCDSQPAGRGQSPVLALPLVGHGRRELHASPRTSRPMAIRKSRRAPPAMPRSSSARSSSADDLDDDDDDDGLSDCRRILRDLLPTRIPTPGRTARSTLPAPTATSQSRSTRTAMATACPTVSKSAGAPPPIRRPIPRRTPTATAFRTSSATSIRRFTTPSTTCGHVPGRRTPPPKVATARAQRAARVTDPNNPDTDGDGIKDGIEDANRNGWVDGDGADRSGPGCDPVARRAHGRTTGSTPVKPGPKPARPRRTATATGSTTATARTRISTVVIDGDANNNRVLRRRRGVARNQSARTRTPTATACPTAGKRTTASIRSTTAPTSCRTSDAADGDRRQRSRRKSRR